MDGKLLSSISTDFELEAKNDRVSEHEISEVDTGGNIVSRLDSIHTISLEREIFLKAILQLLDQRDTNVEAARYTKNGINESNSDIIKSGIIRKATGNSLYLWKEKFVVLRHGEFTYEDDVGWGDAHKRKAVHLTVDQCSCRAFKLKSADGNLVFELTDISGKRRLWMASTVMERDSWVRAINTAIIGSAGDFNIEEDQYLSGIPCSKSQLIATPHLHQEGGNTAPYSTEIYNFNSIRTAISSMISAEDYQQHVTRLAYKQLTVPVFYVQECTQSQNMPQEFLRNSPASKRAILSSQVWKDLDRDVICVNGDIITGDKGPAAMIGAIVRHVLEQAERIRADLAGTGEKFDLNEGHALSCVRDVLLACNRTESGGDTYLCVSTLLSNPDLVVLTPFASEADPMDITVDVVCSKKQLYIARYGGMDRQSQFSTGDSTAGDVLDLDDDSDDEDPIDNSALVRQGAHFRLDSQESLAKCRTTDSQADANSVVDDRSVVTSDSGEVEETTVISAELEDLDSMDGSHRRTDSGPSPDIDVSHKRLDSGQISDSLVEQFKFLGQFTDVFDGPGAMRTSSHSTSSVNSTNIGSPSRRYLSNSSRAAAASAADGDSTTTTSMHHQRPSVEIFPFPAAKLASEQRKSNTSVLNALKDVTRLGTPGKGKQSRKKEQKLLKYSTHFPYLKRPASKQSLTVSSSKSQREDELLTSSHGAAGSGNTPEGSVHSGLFEAIRSASIKRPPRSRTGSSTLEVQGAVEETQMPSMCIRIQVRVKSRYRLCAADPKDETTDIWGSVTGCFHQLFFIKTNCNGRPAVSDRLVTVTIGDS